MRKMIFILIAVLFFAVGASFADNAEDSKKLYDQASALVDEGKKPDAIPLLRQSIQLDESNFWSKKLLVEILSEMGEDLYNNGYEKTAFNYFQEAVKYWSNHPTASYWYNKLKAKGDQLQDNPQQRNENTGKNLSPGQSNNQSGNTAVRNNTGSAGTGNIILSDKQLEKLLKLQESAVKYNEKKQDQLNLILLVAGGSLLAAALFLIVLLAVSRSGRPIRLGKNKKPLDLSTPGMMEKLKDLIKMYKMEDLARIIENGELDWNVIKQYLAELDRKIRLEVLNIVESKINREIQPLTSNQAELLMCLLVDGDDFIRRKANLIMAKSMVDTSRPVQISVGSGGNGDNETTLMLPSSQEIYQRQDHNKRQTDYFLDVKDLKGLIPLARIVDKKMFGNNHSINVAKGTYQVAVAMGISAEESNLFYIAGLAHNIGYLDLPPELVHKEDKLTPEEMSILQTHPEKGLELLDFTRLPEAVAQGILNHHERWDGSGYPRGLKDEEIPVIARIIAVLDAYYALISPRPYRPEKPKEESVNIIKRMKGKSFDPKVVDVFLFLINQNLL